MTSTRKLARIAGSLYLVVAVCGMFAEFFVRSRIVVPGDATATAANIRASATLFRLGFVVDLVQAMCFLLLAMALYLLLRHVDKLVAAAMVSFAAVSVAIMCLNLLNQVAALSIATGGGSDALASLFAELQRDGYLIAQLFFGLYLLPLGYLVVRSGYAPRMVGVLLAIGCFGDLMDVFARFLALGIAETISPFVLAPAVIGEVALMAWLLVRTARTPDRDALVPATV